MQPLCSIMVPLDGSAFAEQALPIAVELARASSACLRLAYVHIPATAWDPGVEFSLFDPEQEQQVREREMAYLGQLARKLNHGGGLHVERVLLSGTIATALAEYVERTGTDLVVMTSHGRGGVSRLLLGNVADHLIQKLRIPVLVVRPEMKQARRGEYGHRRILVPLDGSPLAASVLEQARAFARMTQSELVLLMVVQPVPVLLPPFIWPPAKLVEPVTQRELEATRYLDGLKKELRAEGLSVETRVQTESKVARAILRTARNEACSLIAMATHGASGLDRLMLGSVTDQVVRHADLPVLVLRPELVEAVDEVEADACSLATAIGR